MLAFALRKTSLVKDNFRTGALLGEIELHNRVDTWIPVDHTPGLDNSFVRHKLDVSSYDMPAKKRERTARFPADLRALVSRPHAGLHGRTEQCDPLELLFVGQCFVHALRIRSACTKRSEEHTSELQSLTNLVCRLLLEKKKRTNNARK